MTSVWHGRNSCTSVCALRAHICCMSLTLTNPPRVTTRNPQPSNLKPADKRSAKLSHFVMHRGLIISIIQAVFSAVFYFAPIAIYQVGRALHARG